MKYLFPNFLKDRNEFLKSKEFWNSLCEKILNQHNQSGLWRLWYEEEEQNLEQFDNFPIFSMINVEKTKGFIINQQDPKIHKKWKITAYTKESTQYSDLNVLQYLVFNCNLSEESAIVFERLISQWIKPSCDPKEIEDFIDSSEEINKLK